QAGRAYDFYDAKGVLEAWLTSLGLGLRAAFVPIQDADAPWLHPGRAAGVWIDGQIRVGTVGELHPETAQRLGIGGAVYAEFDLHKLEACLGGAWKAQTLPRYPAVRRDLAVLVPQEVSSAQLLAKAAQAAEQAGDILQDCRVFDVYVGPGVPEGQKSMAVAFTYQSDERTLTDEETEAVERAILRAWEQAFGARLRGEREAGAE
ncbi:MAG: phenylalanine--tRNA ligase subunit beta, partial [Alicyclobacillus shizuokensis]|nr:phenylalanine--tRNA ligase subunit beta [Alicyclobacillus shizuokensis]